MKTLIALLRGVNVGGNNRLPMRDLAKLLEGLGLREVKTYIQSGNVVFHSERTDTAGLATAISAAIGEKHGFTPHVLLLTAQDFQAAITANPFPEGEDEPKSLHLFFLDAVPSEPDLTALEKLRANGERFQLIDKVFYLHAPAGIGRSKLATKVEKALGVPVTARNWQSVNKIMALASALA